MKNGIVQLMTVFALSAMAYPTMAGDEAVTGSGQIGSAGVSAAGGAARQRKSCKLQSPSPYKSVGLQLYAGPASYGDIASDVFLATVDGRELAPESVIVTQAELISSSTTSQGGTTVIIDSQVGMRLELEDGTTVNGTFRCEELNYTP